MSERDPKSHASDDDLLADAIPIDLDAEDDEIEVLEDSSQGGSTDDELAPIDIAGPGESLGGKIQMFGPQSGKHEDKWSRTPNTPGTGAIHVKTFVTKLRLDAIDHLDQQINEWLDSHPQYEVKFVTTTVGKLVGKITEEALFVNVWV